MSFSNQYRSPSEAAKALGTSAKALRIYEERGLIAPIRTQAGWRAYGPDEMNRAADIVALRSLGFSLAQIERVLGNDPQDLDQALAYHQTALEGEAKRIQAALHRVQTLRSAPQGGAGPATCELIRALAPMREVVAAFDLPWPWGGERFELRHIRPLNFIVGPLFSGKTRLLKAIAEALPNAAYLGLDRLDGDAPCPDPALKMRLEQTMAWLKDDGATVSHALHILIAALEADGPDLLIVDMIEQGLDEATQRALAAYLRRRGANAKPIFATTRSCEILDLEAVDPEMAILFCPPNHSPPFSVDPYPGARGYEAAASCLATPEVRARSEGVVAVRTGAV